MGCWAKRKNKNFEKPKLCCHLAILLPACLPRLLLGSSSHLSRLPLVSQLQSHTYTCISSSPTPQSSFSHPLFCNQLEKKVFLPEGNEYELKVNQPPSLLLCPLILLHFKTEPEREMEATMTMDVEAQPSPDIISIKRFGLKNSIQTNFGDDYVFQIIPKDDWSTMAVSLSTNTVKLYSTVAGHYHGECQGHSDTINQILFSGLPNSHVLGSCSSDGTIRIWDTRTLQQVSCISAGSSQEVFSFSVGGPSGNLIAAGCKSQVIFWDWRNNKQIACLEDSHVDDVTQVHFVPNQQGKLVSASVDGLICTFDIAGDINDDDHLESVINVETSISKVGFFGESCLKLWCLTHIETLSIWDWKDARNEVNFTDARSLASEGWSLDNVDYFVDCHYSEDAQQLWAIGGTNAGVLGYFPVNYSAGATVGSAEAILQGGHTSVVRSVLPMTRIHGGPGCDQGIFGWTGGEDGRLCCWLSDDSPQMNRSWISSALIKKSERTRKKNRHQPY